MFDFASHLSQRWGPFGLRLLLALGVLSAPAAQAGPLCPNPPTLSPALAFSLTSYHPGDLDRSCAQRVDAARAAGFTTAAIVPAVMAVDDPTLPANSDGLPAMRTLPASRTMNPGELERCLEYVRRAGMDITFQPHLEHPNTLAGAREAAWRATFDVHPDSNFESAMFGEFNTWLAAHATELAASGTQVDIVPAAELERSTASYPAEWSDLLTRMRAGIPAAIRSRVRVGMNPNWHPMATNLMPTAANCSAYRELVGSFDFVAPSFYGNWQDVLAASDPVAGVSGRWADVRSRLMRSTSSTGSPPLCTVPEFGTARLAVGEFGVGGNTRAIEADLPLTATTVTQRRELIRRLLAWGERGPNATPRPGEVPLPMNFWTLSTFDPVGIAKSDGTVPDLAVVQMLRAYTQARCPGILLPDLPPAPGTGPCPPLGGATPPVPPVADIIAETP
ncbi:MAG: hypothetical protein IT285_04480 [Bdellovibrionales bacterium]|nr:hypothetical protein [Bdellovibrionales bacterium]